MNYFEMYCGISGFTVGIKQAYEKYQEERTQNGQPDSQGTKPNAAVRRKDRKPSRGSRSQGASDSGQQRSEEQGQNENPSSHRRTGKDVKRRKPRRQHASCVGYSEIDQFADAITQYHFPQHRNFGDATRLIPEDIPDFDLLCGGFPCQDFSIAGAGAGLDGFRGSLFYEIVRILVARKKMGKAVKHFFLENVPGLFSSQDGTALKRIILALTEIGYCVEWTCVNSQFHGVPQNRERVFIIGHFGRMPSRTVFPFGDGDPEVDRSGSIGCVSGTISTKNQGPQCQFDGGTTIVGQDISFSLDANYHKGAAPSDMESGMKRQIVNDSTKKGMRTADDIRVGTLRTHNDGKGFREVKGDLAPTLPARAREDGSGQAVIAISVQTPERKKKSQNGRQVKEDGDPSFAVTAQEQPGIYDGDRLRRLTEIECERLQGFEDNWTEYGRFPDGKIKKISATQRYKTTGNAVTTTVIRAIMYRMLTIKCCDEEL